MHYFLRDPLEKLTAAHLEFLKKELPCLGWAKTDAKKMREVQKKKLCENSTDDGPVSRKKAIAGKRQTAVKRTKKTNL